MSLLLFKHLLFGYICRVGKNKKNLYILNIYLAIITVLISVVGIRGRRVEIDKKYTGLYHHAVNITLVISASL